MPERIYTGHKLRSEEQSMNPVRIIAISVISFTIAACGSDFEWFPKAEDTTAPTVSAKVSDTPLLSNYTTHVSSLPAGVTFTANESTTVYYTIDGNTPTTTSATADITSTAAVSGPSITVSGTTLKFLGVDKSSKKNQSSIQTSYIKSP